MTKEEIDSICKKYNIKNYTINPDGSIDVKGDVHLSNKNLKKLPLKFRNVFGDFQCYNNHLIDVNGFPSYKVFNDNNSPVYEIIQLVPPDLIEKFIYWLNEYDVIREGNKIVEQRLEEAYFMTVKGELPEDKRAFKNYRLI